MRRCAIALHWSPGRASRHPKYQSPIPPAPFAGTKRFKVEPLDRESEEHVFYETHVSWLTVDDELPKKNADAS